MSPLFQAWTPLRCVALSILAVSPALAQAPGDIWLFRSATDINSVTLTVSVRNEAVDFSQLNRVSGGPVSVANSNVTIDIRTSQAGPVSAANEFVSIDIKSAIEGPVGVQNDADE